MGGGPQRPACEGAPRPPPPGLAATNPATPTTTATTSPPHAGCHRWPCPPDLGGTGPLSAPVPRGRLCKSTAGRSPGLSFSSQHCLLQRDLSSFSPNYQELWTSCHDLRAGTSPQCSFSQRRLFLLSPPVSVWSCCVEHSGDDILLTRTWPGAFSIPPAAGTLSHPKIPPGIRDLPCSRAPKQPLRLLGVACSCGFGLMQSKERIWG